jgi:hypothetical protein
MPEVPVEALHVDLHHRVHVHVRDLLLVALQEPLSISLKASYSILDEEEDDHKEHQYAQKREKRHDQVRKAVVLVLSPSLRQGALTQLEAAAAKNQ